MATPRSRSERSPRIGIRCARRSWNSASSRRRLRCKFANRPAKPKPWQPENAGRRSVIAATGRGADSLHYEIEQLETRAANARAALTQELLAPTPSKQIELGNETKTQATDETSVACAPGSQFNANAGDDGADLGLVADTLADQRLVLAKQIEWLCQTRLQWEKERAESLAELEVVTATLEDREAEFDNDETQLEENKRALATLAQQIEADRIRAAADINARKAELDRATEELSAKSREVTRREGALADLLRLWGARSNRSTGQAQSERAARERNGPRRMGRAP